MFKLLNLFIHLLLLYKLQNFKIRYVLCSIKPRNSLPLTILQRRSFIDRRLKSLSFSKDSQKKGCCPPNMYNIIQHKFWMLFEVFFMEKPTKTNSTSKKSIFMSKKVQTKARTVRMLQFLN